MRQPPAPFLALALPCLSKPVRAMLVPLHRRGPALTAGHEDDIEDDSIFEWTTPDEGLRLPFERSRQSAVSLAADWDLCISGDGLHHLQQIGAEADYIPLTQVTT